MATAVDDGTAGEMVVSVTYWKGMSTSNSSDSISRTTPPAGVGNDDSDGNGTPPAGSRDDSSTRHKTLDTEGSGEAGFSVLGGTKWGYKGLQSGNFKVEVVADNAEVSLKPGHDRS